MSEPTQTALNDCGCCAVKQSVTVVLFPLFQTLLDALIVVLIIALKLRLSEQFHPKAQPAFFRQPVQIRRFIWRKDL